MRIVIGFACAFAFLLLGAGPASAEPCGATPGDTAILSLEGRDAAYMRALHFGVLTALTPASFPRENIQANPQACTRASFTANDGTYRMFGQMSDSPPRWATGPSGRIAYLAVMPPPHVVLGWAQRGASGPLTFRDPPVYVLAIVNGERRDIFVLFEGVPGDEQLATAFRDALDGRIPLLATFNAETGEVEFVSRQAL